MKCINESTMHLHRKFDVVPTNVRSVEQFIVIVLKNALNILTFNIMKCI